MRCSITLGCRAALQTTITACAVSCQGGAGLGGCWDAGAHAAALCQAARKGMQKSPRGTHRQQSAPVKPKAPRCVRHAVRALPLHCHPPNRRAVEGQRRPQGHNLNAVSDCSGQPRKRVNMAWPLGAQRSRPLTNLAGARSQAVLGTHRG